MQSRSLPLVLALLAGLGISAASNAQQPGLPNAQPRTASSQTENRPPMPIIDVDFVGGTVQEFVRAVQKAAMESSAKTPVNVMMPAEAAEIRLQAVTLKRVSAETALETLRYAFGTQGPQFEARNMSNEGDEGLTFAIQYLPSRFSQPRPAQVMVQPSVSQAYSLRDLISTPTSLPQNDPSLRMSADAVLGALKLAAELEAGDAGVAATQLLFHPDTQLLIARGAPDQHRLIESVLVQLNDTISQRRDLYGSAQSRGQHEAVQQLEFETQMKAAEINADRARSELAPAASELDRLEKLFASGNVSQTEVERARANIQIARANLEQAEGQMKYLKRRFELMQQSRGGDAPALSTGEQVLVLYDLRDLASFKADFYDLVKQMVGREGKMEVRAISGDSTGSILVRATRDQHESLVRIFNTARRLKSNEPKLPGMTLDQLIEKTPKE